MRYLTLACSLAFALAAPRAWAGDAAAEALFRAGRDAAERGDDATACARFEESHRMEPAAGTVLNLALCYERRGQVASAWTRFREARDRMPSNDERVALVDQKIAALTPRLPRLSLRVEDAQAATVLRDGVELGSASLGVAVPVDPGAHRVELRATGRETRIINIELKEGESKEVVLELGAPSAASSDAAAPSKATAASSGSSTRTLGFVVGGIGLAGVAGSLAAGAVVLDRKSTVNRECSGSACTRAGVEAADSGRTWSTVSTVAFVAGAAAVGVGAYLILTAKPSGETTSVSLRNERGAALLSLHGAF